MLSWNSPGFLLVLCHNIDSISSSFCIFKQSVCCIEVVSKVTVYTVLLTVMSHLLRVNQGLPESYKKA